MSSTSIPPEEIQELQPSFGDTSDCRIRETSSRKVAAPYTCGGELVATQFVYNYESKLQGSPAQHKDNASTKSRRRYTGNGRTHEDRHRLVRKFLCGRTPTFEGVVKVWLLRFGAHSNAHDGDMLVMPRVQAAI